MSATEPVVPVPIEHVMDSGQIQFTTTNSIIAVVVVCLSILVAIYLIVMKLKFKWGSLRADYHYQLRFALASSLLLNRTSHLMLLMVFAKGTITEQERYAAILSMNITFVLLHSSYYLTLLLLLFLTLDRYKRINMIVPGMRLHSFFRLLHTLASLFYLFLCGIYIFSYIIIPYGLEPSQKMKMESILVKCRHFVEYPLGAFLMVVYYWFTVSLVYHCALAKHQVSFKSLLKYVSTRYRPKSQEPRIENTTHQQPPADQLVTPRTMIIVTQSLALALKMIALFLLIILADVIILIFLMGSLDVLQLSYDERAAVGMSWMSLHVVCTLKLLDLLLVELRQVRIVVVQEAAKGNKKQKKSNSFSDSESDISGHFSTTYEKTTDKSVPSVSLGRVTKSTSLHSVDRAYTMSHHSTDDRASTTDVGPTTRATSIVRNNVNV